MDRKRYEMEAERLISDRIATLRSLTFDRAGALPEAAGEEAVVAGRKCALTTFRQQVGPEGILVTVQLARRGLFGLGTFHTEKGLIFSRNGPVRDASQQELLESGG
jgi:hypothetical protein